MATVGGEKKLRQALDNALGLVELGADGVIRDANERFAAALGTERKSLVGTPFAALLADPADASRDAWRRALSGEPTHATHALRSASGGTVHFRVVACPAAPERGSIARVTLVCTNASAELEEASREAAARAAQDSERLRSRGALDQITTNVMIANDKFEIVYMNPSLISMLRDSESAIQKELPHFRVDRLMGASIDSFHRRPEHQHRVLQNLRGTHQVQLQLGGRTFKLTASATRDAHDKVVGYSVEWFDLTEQLRSRKEVERVLKAATEGDLTQRISQESFEGFLEEIGPQLNTLLDSISDAFRHVKLAVEQVGQAGGELRSTSQMMSSSSVGLSRAASESAGSIAKSNDMARANADNAVMANQLVTHTSTVAREGRSRMEEMNGAMGNINASAQQIAKIIKVIDEIAFQTNLLALNAAVEAARAGRHGKGFAVVAQEVRSLAERSAKAAKETTQLIEESISRVNDGVRIATTTRVSLEEIVANVVKVVDLVGEISSASAEQSKALEHVKQLVNQVTEGAQAGSQQSTEVAASAEELNRQMDLLRQKMDAYRVADARAQESSGGPVAADVVEQVLELIRTGAVRLGGHAPARAAVPANEPPASRAAVDPRAVLPLDRDERGFGGF